MKPKYTARHNLPSVYRGDTLDGFTIRLENKELAQPIVPESVCMQLRDGKGRIAALMPTQIAVDGLVTVVGLSAEETARLKPQTYIYDIEFTLPDGRVRTYLTGMVEILADISVCQIP